MNTFIDSQIGVLYASDLDMIDRAIFNTEWLLIYRYRESVAAYYVKVMEILGEACSRIMIHQFVYKFKEDVHKDILER
jgi:hypothetical protein